MTEGGYWVNCFVFESGSGYSVSMLIIRLAAASLVLLMLSGCLSHTLFYKDGEQVTRIDRDETNCRVDALARVPVDKRTRYIPPTYDTQTVCNAAGKCQSFHVLISPATYRSYDANEGLRAKATEQCMAQKGYNKVRLPPCDATAAQSTLRAATRVLPPLTPSTCAINLGSGRWQIVTPGP